MVDVLHSLYGRKHGIDSNGNVVIGDGDSVFASNNASTKGPRIASGAVATAPTTAAGLVSYGVHALTSSPVGYLLADPVPGQRVTILAVNPTTATGRFVQVSTANGVTFGSTGGYNKWSSTAAQTLDLIGLTTLIYGLVSNNAPSTVSTGVGSLSTI